MECNKLVGFHVTQEVAAGFKRVGDSSGERCVRRLRETKLTCSSFSSARPPLQPGCSHRSAGAVRGRGVGEGRRGRCDAEEATD